MKTILLPLLVLLVIPSFAQHKITPGDGLSHVGDSVSVSGIIYGGHYFNSPGKLTILILGDTIPGRHLVISIEGNSNNNFSDSITTFYFNKEVSIRGRVKLYFGEPEIHLSDTSQISIITSNEISVRDSNLVSFNEIPSLNLDNFDGCPPIGQTNNPGLEGLNRQKNRYSFPLPVDFNTMITLNSLLAPGNDENRWSVKTAVELTGYVFEVKAGGSETCNCHVNDDIHTDTHIVLVADPKKTIGSKRVIIEVTPRMRFLMAKKGIDWSTAKLKSQLTGNWVRIKGWIFFDLEHTASAENTNPGNAKNWRATSWEVHPITSIEIVNHH